MELKEFVKASLCQIAEGILEASEALKKTNAIVNPDNIIVNSEQSQAYGRTRPPREDVPPPDSRIVEKVEFDVAISVQEGTATNAGLKVAIMSVGLGAGGESRSNSGYESRIKFSIPMVFPTK